MRILDAAAVDALIDDEMVLEAVRGLFSLPWGPEEIGFGRIDLAHPKGWASCSPWLHD
jgi:hypothetical protein